MVYVIVVTARDGSTHTERKSSATAALAFCQEEVLWESCARVVCEQIGFNEIGSYA